MHPNTSFGFSYLTKCGFSGRVPYVVWYFALWKITGSYNLWTINFFEDDLRIYCRDTDNQDNPNRQENNILGQSWALPGLACALEMDDK